VLARSSAPKCGAQTRLVAVVAALVAALAQEPPVRLAAVPTGVRARLEGPHAGRPVAPKLAWAPTRRVQSGEHRGPVRLVALLALVHARLRVRGPQAGQTVEPRSASALDQRARCADPRVLTQAEAEPAPGCSCATD